MQRGDGAVVNKTGWGIKLSFRPILSPLSNWKIRRFELTQTQFQYSTKEGNVKGSIPRSDFLLAEAIENHVLPHRRGHNTKYYPFAMRLWIGQSPFFICVATDQDRQHWIAALNNTALPRIQNLSRTFSSPQVRPDHSCQSLYKQIAMAKESRESRFSMKSSSIDLDSVDDSEVSFSFVESGHLSDSEHHISLLRRRRIETSCEEADVDIILWSALQKLVDNLTINPEQTNNLSEIITPNAENETWNLLFQSTMNQLFGAQTLPEIEARSVFNVKKMKAIERLQSIQRSFIHNATQIYKDIIENDLFPSDNCESERVLVEKGIKFIAPGSWDTVCVEKFSKQASQWKKIVISCCENLFQVYDNYLESQKAVLASEYTNLEKQLQSVAVDPLGVFEDEVSRIETKLEDITSVPIINYGEQLLPLRVPMFCIIDYLGYPVIATACFSSENNEKQCSLAAEDSTYKFLSRVLHYNLTNDQSKRDILVDVIGESKYISREIMPVVLEDRLHWTSQPHETFWEYHSEEALVLRSELCKQYQLVHCKVSPTVFLHNVTIPRFCAQLPRVPLTGNSLCVKLHQFGINLRHLGVIYSLVDAFHKPVILIEMIARCVKTKIREEWRARTNDPLVIWRQWESTLLNYSDWWEVISMKESLVQKYWPRELLEELSYEQIVRQVVVMRLRELLQINEEPIENTCLDTVVRPLPLFTLSQVISPERYYLATRDLPVMVDTKLYYQSIEYETHHVTSEAVYTQKALSLWDIVQELRLETFPSVSTIYEVLHRCKDSIMTLLSLHPDSLLGNLLLGSVYAEIAFLVQKHAIVLQEKQEIEEDGDCAVVPFHLIMQAACSFQRVLLISQKNTSDVYSQFITVAEARGLALDYWNCFLSKYLEKELHVTRTDEWEMGFSLVCEQLLMSGTLRGYEDNGEISLESIPFLESLSHMITPDQWTTPNVTDEQLSALFCSICIVYAPAKGIFKELKDILQHMIASENSPYHDFLQNQSGCDTVVSFIVDELLNFH